MVLKKKMCEITELKKQLTTGGVGLPVTLLKPQTNKLEAVPQKRDIRKLRDQRKENSHKTIEQFNHKFLTDLYSQMDEMFENRKNNADESTTTADTSEQTELSVSKQEGEDGEEDEE